MVRENEYTKNKKKKELITKHCPYCLSDELLYVIDIFAKSKERQYTGEVNCDKCRGSFQKKNITKRVWKLTRTIKGEEK